MFILTQIKPIYYTQQYILLPKFGRHYTCATCVAELPPVCGVTTTILLYNNHHGRVNKKIWQKIIFKQFPDNFVFVFINSSRKL